MNAKEKKYIRNTMFAAVAVIAIYILAQIIADAVLGDSVTLKIDGMSDPGLTASDITAEMEIEGIVEVTDIQVQDGELMITFDPLSQGETLVDILDGDGAVISSEYLHVAATGLITSLNDGSFSHWQVSSFMMLLMLCGMAAVIWISFYQIVKNIRYSYLAIYTCGFGIWITIICALLAFLLIRETDMMNIYLSLKNADMNFMILTSPAILIFCILLSVSNLSLIKHEGFKTRNALGIGLSAAMIIGFLAIFMIDELYTGGSEFSGKVFSAIMTIFYTAYALLECFLIGSIICGSLSANHEPAYDRDYLIILGCKIRKDGTLYPLLQGRADRAIQFYKKQLEKTGKAAIFVPSGGQGKDEITSESEAIANYLRQQGIDDQHIRIENKSRNTKENMEFSRALIEKENPDAKVAFSTTNYHVFRGGIISRQAQFEPDGMGSPTKWYFWPNAYIREVIGMLSYTKRSLIIMALPIIAFLVAIQFIL